KAGAREVEVPIDYCGFPIENVFVVGFGLDYDERYRNLPYIGVLEEEQ
ncbi:MAG: hypoxanthine phosphoribosyltransferase, partial [Thermoanaerobaculia bacterium]